MVVVEEPGAMSPKKKKKKLAKSVSSMYIRAVSGMVFTKALSFGRLRAWCVPS